MRNQARAHTGRDGTGGELIPRIRGERTAENGSGDVIEEAVEGSGGSAARTAVAVAPAALAAQPHIKAGQSSASSGPLPSSSSTSVTVPCLHTGREIAYVVPFLAHFIYQTRPSLFRQPRLVSIHLASSSLYSRTFGNKLFPLLDLSTIAMGLRDLM